MAKFSFRRESDAPRARRFTELFLLVLAVGISSFGMYLIDPEHAFDTSKSQWLPCTVVLGAGALLIHLVMQFRARYADPFILPLVVALNGIGLTMIYRLDPQIAAPVGDGQLMWTGVSMVLCAIIVFVLRDYRLLRKVTYTSLVLSMILLIMPLVPGLGMELNGARIWIHIGNRTFQPGEVAKITLAIFFAGYLATHRDLILVAGRRIGPINLPRLRDLAPVFLAWIVSLGVLVFQKDLGSAITHGRHQPVEAGVAFDGKPEFARFAFNNPHQVTFGGGNLRQQLTRQLQQAHTGRSEAQRCGFTFKQRRFVIIFQGADLVR